VAVIIEHKVREEERVFVFPWQSGLYHTAAAAEGSRRRKSVKSKRPVILDYCLYELLLTFHIFHYEVIFIIILIAD
jgi:hypothetical protein